MENDGLASSSADLTPAPERVRPRGILHFLLIGMPRYCWLYFRITVHAGIIWGRVDDHEQNDELLAARYPKEWKELQAIRGQYIPKPLLAGREEPHGATASTEAKP